MKQSKRDREKQEARESLEKWLKPGGTVYTILDHVSRSGMSRQIRVVVPYTRDDGTIDFVHPNHAAAQLLDWRLAKRGDGIVVGGCGMDMGFHLIYSISRMMFPEGFGCVGERCPSNDHSNGDRDYTPHALSAEELIHGRNHEHWHRDGGYALRQRWL